MQTIFRNIIFAVFFLLTTVSVVAGSGITEYTVKRGDTLFSIARSFGVTPQELSRENKIDNPNTLFAGQKIKIPPKNGGTLPSGMSFQWPARIVHGVQRDGNADVPTLGVLITVPGGSYISASAEGTVSKIGYVRGFGNYIVVTHSGRVMTVYSNLDYIMVKEGDKVTPGLQIAKLSPGKNNFHFQINNSGKPLDAMRYLPGR